VRFADYCEAVARRYPWVRYYTPANEIYITAKFSAKDGLWNEQLKSDRGFVTAMKNVVAASILGTQAIAKHRPDCIIVQSESAEYVHEVRAVQSREVILTNKQRFISLDLLYAVPPDADICMYLMDNGLTREEFDWFMKGEPPGYQIMGNDYYGRNEHILKPDGSMCPAEDVMGWYQITKQYYDRYKKPVMHTETNVFDEGGAPTWLWKQWVNVLRMRRDGVPVLGFTWYSLTDQVDWDIGLAEKRGKGESVGPLRPGPEAAPRRRSVPAAPAGVRPDHHPAACGGVHGHRPAGPPQGGGLARWSPAPCTSSSAARARRRSCSCTTFGGSSRSWAPVIDRLRPAHRCIAPDLRGFGRSPPPPDGWTVTPPPMTCSR
jgi:hypothetical protein